MLNNVTIMGRLAKDPELRKTTSGLSVTTVSIACDRDIRNANGEKETDWVDITAWRGTADFICNNFTKGRMIIVEGRLQTRSWTDKDGNKQSKLEVLADNVYFGDSKKSSGNDGYSAGTEEG